MQNRRRDDGGGGTVGTATVTAPDGRPRASWVDAVTDFVDRVPAPRWLLYAGTYGGLALAANATGWLHGTLALGSFDAYLSSLPVYPVGAVAAIHYLDREAGHALGRLRPALPVSDREFGSLHRKLTTLPAVPTLAWTLAGAGFAVAYVLFGGPPPGDQGPAAAAFDAAIALVGFPLLAVLFFHTVRQLALISRIQERVAIDLFALDPLLAFSRVTARNGLVILALAYVGGATDPRTFEFSNPTLVGFLGVATLTAIAAFVLPMLGLHGRIGEEKARLTAEADRDLEAGLLEVGRRARDRDLRDADALNKQLASLVLRRDVIGRIPTWPWQPGTLRAFATAVLLPIALGLLFRVLDRLLVQEP